VLRSLKAKGYSLHPNKKFCEGAQHPHRDAEFEHIINTFKNAIAGVSQ
jgi:hypothetical protein